VTNPIVDDRQEAAAVRTSLSHAHDFNDPDGRGYRALDEREVCRCLNECRVGLCLSAVEGGMLASLEYLLCGLPVVSTESLGGRDVFFDDVNALLVDATPEAVRAGVDAMRERDLPPELVRESVMPRVLEHRRTLQATVQSIYDREGVARSFADEWPHLFYNRMQRYRTHEEIVRDLEQAPASELGA
jgi:glycosyltransferase involved in cell wall biosynthesis